MAYGLKLSSGVLYGSFSLLRTHYPGLVGPRNGLQASRPVFLYVLCCIPKGGEREKASVYFFLRVLLVLLFCLRMFIYLHKRSALGWKGGRAKSRKERGRGTSDGKCTNYPVLIVHIFVMNSAHPCGMFDNFNRKGTMFRLGTSCVSIANSVMEAATRVVAHKWSELVDY